MKLTKHAFAIATVIAMLSPAARVSAESFGFDSGNGGWGMYGEGNGVRIGGLGHETPGCMFMECGPGRTTTLRKSFELKPGRYLVTAWIRGFEVRSGKFNRNIVVFYDVGDGYEIVVDDLKGTFQWSKLGYTLDVADKPIKIWYRLKTPGSVWIDDISIAPHVGEAISCRFERSDKPFPEPNPPGHGARCGACYR